MSADPDIAASRSVGRRTAMAREWESTLARVRQLDGFADLLTPRRLQTLLPAAGDGPIVIVNVSQWRCDAMIVAGEGVQVTRLADVTREVVRERAGEFLDGLRGGDEAMMSGVLEWLWDAIAEPALGAAGVSAGPEPGQAWTRLWWCPSAELALLPLHAAGRADDRVLDRVVSSYTPALGTLIQARAAAAAPAGPDARGMLAVMGAVDEARRPAADRELTVVADAHSDHGRALAGEAARSATVTEALGQVTWLHYTGAARQDLTAPASGGLYLRDRLLTVAELGMTGYRGEFAFLSTGPLDGVELPPAGDAMPLPWAVHLLGWQHVIGALWSVDGPAAAEVADAVYAALATSGELRPAQAAIALHDAVRALRDSGAPLASWAPFTHTGP